MSRSYGDRSDRGDKLLILKKKIKFLERENSRQRKEINRLLGKLSKNEIDAESRDSETQKDKTLKALAIVKCEKCHSMELMEMVLDTRGGKRTYAICQDCGHRKRVSAVK